MTIHPTAIIESGAHSARMSASAPYCVVGADVRLDDGVILHSHVVLAGRTAIGAGTRFFPSPPSATRRRT